MDINKFYKVSESLRAYQRADLNGFEPDLGDSPVDKLYVDPLPNNGILSSVTSGNTTFLLGRKGTGKSTVFARAQSAMRADSANVISAYIDVKRVYDLSTENDLLKVAEGSGIDLGVLSAHLLRKQFLGQILAELLKEIDNITGKMSFLDRFFSKKRSLEELSAGLNKLSERVKRNELSQEEIPTLLSISRKAVTKNQGEVSVKAKGGVEASASLANIKLAGKTSVEEIDRVLEDTETYSEYSDLVYKSLPFQDILESCQELLHGASLKRLVVFFDDFSELRLVDQKLFVDVILSPLNNSSGNSIKLKVAGYPGRVYYGKIDPSKVETIELDFSSIFEASEVQSMERDAVSYASRLLDVRFKAFGIQKEHYFDGVDNCLKTLFQATFNVPRMMGAILHICYLDAISKGKLITPSIIRLAAQKYYSKTIVTYFDKLNRFALEPFQNKLDRVNQKGLLDAIVIEARRVRLGIQSGSIGGTFFEKLGNNPPTSHFIVSKLAEGVFHSLESNFLITRYKDTRDKNGKPVVVYALNLGLVELERMEWGYPDGREYRNYFVQRCFDYTSSVEAYLTSRKTIECPNCGANYSITELEKFQLYKMRCPECDEIGCFVKDLSESFEEEVKQFKALQVLEPVEFSILDILSSENKAMAASEISVLIDTTYQMVGRRTNKLRDLNFVSKERDSIDNRNKSRITEHASQIFFSTEIEKI